MALPSEPCEAPSDVLFSQSIPRRFVCNLYYLVSSIRYRWRKTRLWPFGQITIYMNPMLFGMSRWIREVAQNDK